MAMSPWDRLPHPNPLGFVPRDNRTPYRIEVFEQALSDPSSATNRLGADLRARREHWRREVSQPSKLAAVFGFVSGKRNTGPTGATLLWIAILLAFASVTTAYFLNAASTIGLILVVLTPFIAIASWQEGKRVAVRPALFHDECPQCGYHLTGNDAIPAAHLDGEHCGPQQCPECGTPWPLIPPPAPGDPTPLCQTPAP